MLPRAIKRLLHQATLSDQSYRFMFDRAPDEDLVVIDCETTGLNVRTDDIVAIAAIKIRGNRILTSEHFEAVVHPDSEMGAEAIKIHRLRQSDVEAAPIVWKVLPSFLRFIGARPLIGYYVDFDVAMLDKYILPLVGIELPNQRIEVSRIYYECKYGDAPPNTSIDLSFAAILRDLDIPTLAQHDAFDDAVMTAMMFLQLRDLAERGVRIARQRTSSVFNPTGA
jgi:DNA polymerase III subunit epsilon